MSNADVMNDINQNCEDRKDDFKMKEQQLVKVMEAREILDRRLEEGQHYGGIVKFAKCIIREGEPYLGNITSFGVNDKNEFLIDVEIDKAPDELYTFAVPVNLYVGSNLYFVFRRLSILNGNGEADLERLDGKRVEVVLGRESGGYFCIDRIDTADEDAEETFSEEDFMQPDDEE